MQDFFKIEMPAGEIPLGETVTKTTGEKEYVLLDKLRIFPVATTSKERRVAKEEGRELPKGEPVPAPEGHRFLVHDGNANMVEDTKVLSWRIHRSDLTYHVMQNEMDQPIEVTLPIGQIPLGAVVRYPRGKTHYKLQENLRAEWLAPGVTFRSKRTIRFMVQEGPDEISVNAVSSEVEAVWVTTTSMLAFYLKNDPRQEEWFLGENGEVTYDWED